MRIISHEALAAAAGSTPRPLGQMVFPVVRVDSDLSDEHLLLTGRIELRYELHPALQRWLTAAGWQKHGVRFETTPPPRKASDPRIAALMTANPALGAAALWGATARTAAASTGAAAGPGRVSPIAHKTALVTLEDLRVLFGDDASLVVADSRFAHLWKLYGSTLLVDASATNPARAFLTLGASTRTASATDALAVVATEHQRRNVVVSDEIVDVAAIAASGPAGRAGLHPMQDEAVSALCATEIGIALVAPPGSGKTVIAASALAARLGDQDRCLIAAPSAVLGQWELELAAWAPNISARVVTSVDVLRRGITSGVTVVSHDIAARWSSTARTRLEIVVVDEAAVVLPRSDRASNLWRLRALSRIGWALTGTPTERAGDADIAALVAWARGLPRAAVTPQPSDMFAPLLAGTTSSTPLPEMTLRLVPVTPTTSDSVMLDELHDLAVQSTTGFGAHRFDEHARRRLGGSSAGQHRSAKTDAALARLSEHAALQRSALLFSSNTATLDTLVELLTDAGVPAAVLSSRLGRQARTALLSAFATGHVLVLAVPPGSQRGVNLQRADLIVHMDLPETSAQFSQRNARAVRLGGTHTHIEVWVPFFAATADEQWVHSLCSNVPVSPATIFTADH